MPGGWDVLNVRTGIFPSSNSYGIPDMRTANCIPKTLTPFPQHPSGKNEGCHFFLDDYRFERVWNRPGFYLPKLKLFYTVLTPDFSLYTDYPHAVNIWNTYRNRWMGCFWQSHGLEVIPTLSWANVDSFDYAFLGVPHGAIVAIATPDIRKPDVYKKFTIGFDYMMKTLEPHSVLVYGNLPDSLTCAAFKHYKGYGERFQKHIVNPTNKVV
jgi:hypothetical protein